jgi:hypothetical protein
MNRREFLKKSLEGIIMGVPLLCNCEKNPINSEPKSNINSIVKDNIEYYVETNKSTYKLGENVKIIRKVSNLGSKEVTLNTYQDPEFNILIQKDGETTWALGHWFKMYSPGINLSAGEILYNPGNWSKKNSSPYEWDMRYDEWDGNNKNKLVEPGIYNVIFVVYASPKTEVGVPIAIHRK